MNSLNNITKHSQTDANYLEAVTEIYEHTEKRNERCRRDSKTSDGLAVETYPGCVSSRGAFFAVGLITVYHLELTRLFI